MLLWLHSLGATVTGYALAAPEEGLYKDIKGTRLCQSIIADIRDKERLKEEILAVSARFYLSFSRAAVSQAVIRNSC